MWTAIYVLPDDFVIIAFGIKFKLQDSAGGILLGIRDEGYAFLTEEAVAQIARRAETTESFSELIRTLGMYILHLYRIKNFQTLTANIIAN